jgi:DNA-3-methyladenine glycosylase
VRKSGRRLYGARIVEVEAYLGVNDPAAHTFGGRRTERVEPMWGGGGLLYVYFVYGMHFCANVVTRREGEAEAVLLRAAAHPRAPSRTLSGPGRLCRAMGITRGDSGRDLAAGGPYEIRLAPRGRRSIVRRARIGVDSAGEARLWPLRYFLKGEPAVTFSRAIR